jgi:hypothetical protein
VQMATGAAQPTRPMEAQNYSHNRNYGGAAAAAEGGDQNVYSKKP